MFYLIECKFIFARFCDKDLQLKDAQWTARQSNGGFSVTFFWPALNPSEVDVKTTVPVVRKKKRRRRKGKAKAQPHKDTLEATVAHHTEEKTCSAASVSPVNAHQSVVVAESAATAHQPKSAPVDLTTCDSVSYEMTFPELSI